MSLRNKIISAAASGLAVAAFSTFAAAQTNNSSVPTMDNQNQEKTEGFGRHGDRRGKFGGHKGMRGDHGMMGGLRDLNLTDAQKQQIHSIMEANRPDQASFEQIKPLMEAKRSGTLTDDQKTQLKAFREQQKAKMENVHQQVLAVLTVEQKTQLEQKRQERMEKREQHRQMRKQNKQNENNPQSN